MPSPTFVRLAELHREALLAEAAHERFADRTRPSRSAAPTGRQIAGSRATYALVHARYLLTALSAVAFGLNQN